MKAIKLILIGFMLGIASTIPNKARSEEEVAYRIATLKGKVKKALRKGDPFWKACGNYFAKAETRNGKIVHFTFKKRSPGGLNTVFAFATANRLTISINEKLATPSVVILGDERTGRFILRMNMRQYRAGLPCLASGIKA